MNHRVNYRISFREWLIAILCLFPLLAGNSTGEVLAQSPLENSPALVRVDFASLTDLRRLTALELPLHGPLFSAGGGAYALAIMDAGQQERLRTMGFGLQVLDTDSRGQDYYLLLGRQHAFRRADIHNHLLMVEGDSAVASLTERQAEQAAGFGIEILPFQPRLIPLPEFQQIETPSTSITFDALIQEMIQGVESSTNLSYVSDLSGEWAVLVDGDPYTFNTRFTHTDVPIKKATEFGLEHFEALGLPGGYHYYNIQYGGNWYEKRNVIAEQTGLTQPERIFLITAHIDSISQDPFNEAPGADDNASGAAGVMVAADILSQYDFGCTLRYVLFTGEEQGLIGSQAYADMVASQGQDIAGVLNLDMVAYNSDSFPITDLHARSYIPGSIPMAELFANVISVYGLNLDADILVDNYLGAYSDNQSFWAKGYPAILAIEDKDDFSPYYHKTSDLLSTLDAAYFNEFVKAAVGTFAHMGCLLEGQLSGTVSDALSGAPVPNATVEARPEGGRAWTTSTGLDGSYHLVLQPGTYNLTVSAPTYAPSTSSGIIILHDQTTPLDIPLDAYLSPQGLDFGYDPASPLAGETISFYAAITGGTQPVTYNWDFGDGRYANGQEVSHFYTSQDVYSVTLTASNGCSPPAVIAHPISITGFAHLFPLVCITQP